MPAVGSTYLWLLALPGVGRKTALLLGRRLPAGVGAAEGDLRDALRLAGDGIARFKLPDVASLAAARAASGRTMDDALAAGMEVHGFDDASFPARLRRIPDPPAVIFTKGRSDALHRPAAIALIGTREPSDFGLRAARRIGSRLPGLGAAVVSGLAVGCDAAGHWGCVDSRGVGIAVLAHGLHTVSPAANRGLAEKLLELQGCLVSEYPPGVLPQRTFFVERDRIQSGLSDAVVVIETAEKGGTMHTVRFAQEQRRPVGCVDHPPDLQEHAKVAGNRALIRAGGAAALPDLEALSRFVSAATGLGANPTPEAATDGQGGPGTQEPGAWFVLSNEL